MRYFNPTKLQIYILIFTIYRQIVIASILLSVFRFLWQCLDYG